MEKSDEKSELQTYVLRFYQKDKDRFIGVLKEVLTGKEHRFTKMEELMDFISGGKEELDDGL